MTSVIERERRWLIDDWPTTLVRSRTRCLEQGILDFNRSTGTVRRLRRDLTDPQQPICELTDKAGTGRYRQETTKRITASSCDILWAECLGRPYHKDRHCLPIGDLTVEADIFGDHLGGLKIAEIEFGTNASLESFQPLPWFGPEVSDDDRFSNARLGVEGLPPVFRLWERFGKPLRRPEVPVDVGLDAVTEVIKIELGQRQRPLILGTAGGSASGKTTRVAAELHRRFPGQSVIVTQDDYYRGRSFMARSEASGRKLSWDEPEAVNLDLLALHLGRLIEGRTIRKPIHDFATGEPVGEEDILPAPVIIIEGLFPFHPPILPLLDLRLFVAVGAHSQIMRRTFRDPERTGQEPGEISHYLTTVVMPMHDRFVESTRPLADITFTNDYQPEIEAARAGLGMVQLKFPGWVSGRVLRRAGAALIAATHQVDDYLEPERPLGREIFRIRSEGSHQSLAYKGPPTAGWDRRPTLHFSIDEETANALRAIYRRQLRRVTKDRTVYVLPDMMVALDDVTVETPSGRRHLGHMTEVRFLNPSITPDAIATHVRTLDLSMNQHITTSYALL